MGDNYVSITEQYSKHTKPSLFLYVTQKFILYKTLELETQHCYYSGNNTTRTIGLQNNVLQNKSQCRKQNCDYLKRTEKKLSLQQLNSIINYDTN